MSDELTTFERKARIPTRDSGENSLRIPDNDPLLRQLLRIHEDRRYESVTFIDKRKAKHT